MKLPSSRANLLIILCGLAGMATPSLWLWMLVSDPDEGVRIRSSLSFDMGSPPDFNWHPTSRPSSFLINRGGATDSFLNAWNAVQTTYSPPADDNFKRGLAIARYLIAGPKRVESPIRSDLETTLRGITSDGRGYCADFAKVYNAIALAGNLPVRQWGFSFDAFGSGHTFNEIYDAKRMRWILVDSFHSLYFEDSATGEPLSTIELHDRLLGEDDADVNIHIVRIDPDHFPFRSDSIAFDYYRRGMPQLYLVWGNNVFDYEQDLEFKVFGHVSRSLTELVSIMRGNYARMRVYPDGVSDRDVTALFAHRNELIAALASWLVSVALFSLLLWRNILGPGLRRRLSAAKNVT